MAGYISDDTRKVTTHRLVEMKQRGEKISMLTSYDYTMAQIVDGAGMDVILVGDSASNVMAGNVTTLPITLDQMIYHAKSVVRGVKRAMVVVDMPFALTRAMRWKGCFCHPHYERESCRCFETGRWRRNNRYCKAHSECRYSYYGTSGTDAQSINKYGTYTVRAKDDTEVRNWCVMPICWKRQDALPLC